MNKRCPTCKREYPEHEPVCPYCPPGQALDEDDVADLLKQIRAMGKGTQYYVPLGRKK